MAKIAVISDVHAPYQDNKSIELACLIIQDFKPTRVYNLGDGGDFYQFSKFSQDAARVLEAQNDFDKFYEVNKQLKSAAPEAIWTYIPGNHDNRWLQYLRAHPRIHFLEALKLEKMLRLDDLGIRLGREQEQELDNRIALTHSRYCSINSAYTAKANVDKVAQNQQSIFVGHSHRQGMFFVTGPRLSVVGVEVGCLCDPTMEYTNGHPNWQMGISLIETEGYLFGTELITFHGYKEEPRKTIWRGKEYIVR